VNKLKEEKLKQLKIIFESETNLKEYAANKSNQLVHEVKIRINNK
jgi:hypothetical protein